MDAVFSLDYRNRRKEYKTVETILAKKTRGPAFMKAAASRIGALILALVLCVGLLPHTAWAEGTASAPLAETAGQATLTIVFGLGSDGSPNVAVNKTYGFAQGATLKDLLDAAVAAGDLEAYGLNGYGYVQSITRPGGVSLENAADFATYWSSYVDGAYYAGTDTVATMALEDGAAYQFAWESYPTAAAPDWGALGKPSAGEGTAGAGKTAGTAALSVVFGLGADGSPNIAVNKSYGFAQGATLKDLLDAAVAAGDLEAYGLNSYGYVQSITRPGGVSLENAADFATYWSSYVDGAYYAGTDTVATMALEDGAAYQFAWESYPTAAAPDWGTISKPETSNNGGGDDGNGGDKGDGGALPQQPPAEYSQEAFDALFANISALYASTGEDWKALEMAAIGKAGSVDKGAIVANAVAAFQSPGTTDLQRSILALTALGIDAADVTSGGQSYNLVTALATAQIAHNTANGKMFALLAYASGPYVPPANTLETTSQLINDVLTLQNADGGWSFSPGTPDADMTAIGIAALAPYASTDPRIVPAVTRALTALRALQLPSGGFASSDSPGVLNTNSTAMAIIALAAVGIDAQTWAVAPDAGQGAAAGATPLTALLSQANAAQNGFLYQGQANDMATEQGFRALVAYQGLKNTGAAYNVYTQAASGAAGQAVIAPPPTDNASNPPAEGSGSPDGGLAATGDDMQAKATLTAALGLAALASIAALRRHRLAKETASQGRPC